MINRERMAIANKILVILLGATHPEIQFIVDERNCLRLTWINHRGQLISRPWATRGGSCYPSWSDKLSTGGTMITAIAQLALWVRGLPCYSIDTWMYWFGKSVGMKGKEGILPLLRDSDYPRSRFECAFCGEATRKLDWYWFSPHPKHSGFGCYSPECNAIQKLRTSLTEKVSRHKRK